MSAKPQLRKIIVPRGTRNIKKSDIKAALKAVEALRIAGKLPKKPKPIHLHIPKWA